MAIWDDVRKGVGVVAGGAAGIALGGPAGIPGAIAGIGGAIAGGSDPAQKALIEAEKATKTAAEVGEKIAIGVGEVIIKVAETAIDIVKSLIPGAIGIRPLRGSERLLAERVFKGTVQLHRVRIVSIYGYGGRPFVMPGSLLASVGWQIPAVGPLLAWTSIVSGLANEYLIFFGAAGFNDSINYKLGMKADGTVTIPGQKLIHELTHVWQGHHKLFAPSYMVNSLWHQCKCDIEGGKAYDYTTGKQWSEYEAEQQASIVEHWFRDTNQGLDERADRARQPYIDTNIRKGSIDAQSANLGRVASGLTKMLDSRPVAPTMTQLLDVLDALKPQRMALMPYQHQFAIRAQIQVLDAQIANYEAMVRAMVAQGALIEDRARFAISMGQGPRISATAPAKLSPILRR